MIAWPPKLVHDISRRRCIAFLGAGVSRRAASNDGSRPPLWRDFLIQALEKCSGSKAEINRLVKGGDYLSACQIIKSRLGQHNWHDLLEENFLNPNYSPDQVHQSIFDLDLPIVATTNIDTIYDRFLNANYQGAVVVKPYHDDSIGRYVKGDASTRLLIKVHGSVDNLDNTVFTREEYASARHKFSQFYDLLSSLLSTQTLLFIGYSLADPDINLLLEDYARRFRSPRPHYLLTADRATNDMVKLFEKNYSIKVLRYSPNKEHQELVDSLHELSSLAALERLKMANSTIW